MLSNKKLLPEAFEALEELRHWLPEDKMKEIEEMLKQHLQLVPENVEWRGNYVALQFRDSDAVVDYLRDVVESVLTYVLRRWNPLANAFENVEMSVGWLEGTTLKVPRGLVRYLQDRTIIRLRKEQYWLVQRKGIDKVVVRFSKFLRDYQREAIKSMLKDIIVQGASTLMAVTGSGKSVIALELIKQLFENNIVGRGRVFILTLSVDLIRQFRQFQQRFGYPFRIGLFYAEEQQLNADVIAVTVQSLYKALREFSATQNGNNSKEGSEVKLEVSLPAQSSLREELVKRFMQAELVIFDECQHVPAHTVKYCLKHAPNAIRIGLSATPWRDDGRDLEVWGMVGWISKRRISYGELIEKGFLVPVKIFMVVLSRNFSTEENPWRPWTWVQAKNRVLYDEYRNEEIRMIVEKLVKEGLAPILVLVREVKQGKVLYEKLKDIAPAKFVWSYVGGVERERIFDAVREGRIQLLIATTLADEGLDLPPLRSLVLAGAGKSKVKTIQRVGRVMRPWKDKKFAIVVDLIDKQKYFMRQAQEREAMYRDFGLQVHTLKIKEFLSLNLRE